MVGLYCEDSLISSQVVTGQARCIKVLLDMPPAATRAYLMDLLGCLCHFSHCLYHITSDAMTYYLRSCPPIEGHNWSPAGHRFYHKEAKRLRPGDGSKKTPGPTE